MQFKRLVKRTGPCAWSRCSQEGKLLYSDGTWQYRVCCKDHAVIAAGEWAKVPADVQQNIMAKKFV